MIKTELLDRKDLVFQKLVKKTTEYVLENKLKSVILGISGGIDSTLVAAILNQVSKNIKDSGVSGFKFIGVSMPTTTTDPTEYKSSILVGEAFCDSFMVLDKNEFTDMADRFWGMANNRTFTSVSDEIKLRAGNIKSRLRTVYLYDLAKAYKGMVVGTDNYTEHLLGFSTIGGDGLFDYCPIQWLWKTEVFELSKWLVNYFMETQKFRFASAISFSLSLKPQDGLGISDSDMDQIGAKDYYEVDEILYNDINHHEQSASKETIEKVLSRYHGSEYKRKLPISISRDDLGI